MRGTCRRDGVKISRIRGHRREAVPLRGLHPPLPIYAERGSHGVIFYKNSTNVKGGDSPPDAMVG